MSGEWKQGKGYEWKTEVDSKVLFVSPHASWARGEELKAKQNAGPRWNALLHAGAHSAAGECDKEEH